MGFIINKHISTYFIKALQNKWRIENNIGFQKIPNLDLYLISTKKPFYLKINSILLFLK